MPQRAVTIERLSRAFEVVKEMQANVTAPDHGLRQVHVALVTIHLSGR